MSTYDRLKPPEVPKSLRDLCESSNPFKEQGQRPGLVVIGEVRGIRYGDSRLLLDFAVDFTTRKGRRTIAEVAQWAMTNGCGLYTRPWPA